MPNLAQGFGPQGFEPSGGPQVMSPEQKLQSMLETMQGAPNSVLMMIARILQSGQGQQQAPQAPQGPWNNMFPMPPVHGPAQFPGVNAGELPMPMRPTEPPQPLSPQAGWIRG